VVHIFAGTGSALPELPEGDKKVENVETLKLFLDTGSQSYSTPGVY
jgi:hypothetical protein